MSNKTKAPTVAAAGAKHADRATFDESQVHDYSIPQLPQQCNGILRHIPFGREDAIRMRDLERLTGYSNRTTRAYVAALVKKGEPVLTDNCPHTGGVWRVDLATINGQQEAASFLRQQTSHARSIYAKWKPCKQKQQASK